MVTPAGPDRPFNPYEAPRDSSESPVAPPSEDDPEAAALRRPHLPLEAAVRLLGTVGYVLAFGMLAMGLMAFLFEMLFWAGLLGGTADSSPRGAFFLLGFFWPIGASAIATYLGRDMRRFRPHARIGWSTLSLLATLTFVTGTGDTIKLPHPPLAIGGLLLLATTTATVFVVLVSSRTIRLFRPDYREAVFLTPGLRPRLDRPARFFVTILLLLDALGIALLVASEIA